MEAMILGGMLMHTLSSTRIRSSHWVLVVILCGSCFGGRAQPAAPPLPGVPSLPASDVLRSPFQSFRELLAATPSEREEVLKKKSEVHRQHLEARLREFDPLSASEREVRLRVMELRWFLVPLLAAPVSNRVERLAVIPEDMRRLVEDRLQKWDALPQDLKNEAVRSGTLVGYIARPETGTPEEQVRFWNNTARGSNAAAAKPSLAPQSVASPSVSVDERKRRLAEHMGRFLELSAAEKQKALEKFSGTDRLHVGETLKKLELIAPDQRKLYLESFQKFSELDEESRRAFIKNAERWKNLPEDERRALRELFTKMPPLPPGFDGPPLPPLPGKLSVHP